MKISSCTFGKLVYMGTAYSSDLIIYPDRVDDLWWRDQGHLLTEQDIGGILDAEPEVLIIGTGQFGMMKVDQDLKKKLEKTGIELVIARTKEASEAFNRCAREGKKVIGAFHLTC